MTKKVLIVLAAWAVIWLLLYVLGAFVAWSWNPATWDFNGRLFLAFAGASAAVAIAPICLAVK